MTDRYWGDTALTLFKLFVVGGVVIALVRLAFYLGGVVLGGVGAVFGIGLGMVMVAGTLVVVFSLLIAPFVLIGWLASKGWRFLKEGG